MKFVVIPHKENRAPWISEFADLAEVLAKNYERRSWHDPRWPDEWHFADWILFNAGYLVVRPENLWMHHVFH